MFIFDGKDALGPMELLQEISQCILMWVHVMNEITYVTHSVRSESEYTRTQIRNESDGHSPSNISRLLFRDCFHETCTQI